MGCNPLFKARAIGIDLREMRFKRKKLTYGDISVRSLKHFFFHALGTERGSENPSHCFTSGNVGLLSIDALKTSLLILLSLV